MSKTLKYLLFTFISAYILDISVSRDLDIGSYGSLVSASSTSILIMFMPTVGALIAGADIREFGWKPDIANSKKLILLAWLLPTVQTALGAALYYIVFPSEFDTTGIFLQISKPDAFNAMKNSGGSYGSYVIRKIIMSVVSPQLLLAVFQGLGEEIGWRGFLFPRLKMKYGRTRGLLLGGVIHGAWHFPIMLLAGYEYGMDYIGAPVLGLIAFCIFTIATGIVSDYLYEKSECILLPALYHGAINRSFNPYMLNNCEHIEHSIFGPADIGLIGVIPLLGFALYLLYKENKCERAEDLWLIQ